MNICDVYKIQILILTFLIIGAVILFVAAWIKNRDLDKNITRLEKLFKDNTVNVLSELSDEALMNAMILLDNKHMEDDFQHFLSYNRFSEEPVENIGKMRKAFEAAYIGGK
jgi:ABC-type protease/lipase transport system fused ATPase/permease subunit